MFKRDPEDDAVYRVNPFVAVLDGNGDEQGVHVQASLYQILNNYFQREYSLHSIIANAMVERYLEEIGLREKTPGGVPSPVVNISTCTTGRIPKSPQ